MPADLEKLAYELALRALDKQERLVEELRARTGLVLAASSVAASLLGRRAFHGPGSGALALLSIACFVVSIAAAVFVLLPRGDLTFSLQGIAFLEALSDSDSSVELCGRAAAALDRVWEQNDATIRVVTHAFSAAALALAIEVTALALLLGATVV